MAEPFARHRQPWKQEEIQKLHLLAGKGMSLKAVAKALTRTEESVKERAKQDGLKISSALSEDRNSKRDKAWPTRSTTALPQPEALLRRELLRRG